MASKTPPSYDIKTSYPEDYPVFRVVRTKGRDTRTVGEYTSAIAAEGVRNALNAAAPYED